MTVPAKWSLNVTKRSVDPDGAVRIIAALLDDGVKQGDLIAELTAKRHLNIEWHDAAGSAGLAGFSAWSKEV